MVSIVDLFERDLDITYEKVLKLYIKKLDEASQKMVRQSIFWEALNNLKSNYEFGKVII